MGSSSPKSGMKIKNAWNHHAVEFPELGRSPQTSVFHLLRSVTVALFGNSLSPSYGVKSNLSLFSANLREGWSDTGSPGPYRDFLFHPQDKAIEIKAIII